MLSLNGSIPMRLKQPRKDSASNLEQYTPAKFSQSRRTLLHGRPMDRRFAQFGRFAGMSGMTAQGNLVELLAFLIDA